MTDGGGGGDDGRGGVSEVIVAKVVKEVVVVIVVTMKITTVNLGNDGHRNDNDVDDVQYHTRAIMDKEVCDTMTDCVYDNITNMAVIMCTLVNGNDHDICKR